MNLKKIWKKLTAVIVTILVVPCSYSEIVIFVPKGNKHALNIAKEIQSNINKKSIIKDNFIVDEKNDIIITLGKDVFEEIRHKTKNPIIASFIPKPEKLFPSEKNIFLVNSYPSPKQIYSFLSKNFKSKK